MPPRDLGARAQSRLLEEDITAARIAHELGYQSEAAFNRAFTRIIGRTPGSIRRGALARTKAEDVGTDVHV